MRLDGDTGPSTPPKTPKGLNPGMGPERNIYRSALVAGKKAQAYYVKVTDACDYTAGPTTCANDNNRLFEVEVLGPAMECPAVGGGVTPCYLGFDGAIHDLSGRALRCGREGCLAGPATTAPNPVFRIRADITGPSNRVYPDVCPAIDTKPKNPLEGQKMGRPNPNYPIPYEDDSDDPPCSQYSTDCNIRKVLKFIDQWLGWVPALGDAASGALAADAMQRGDWGEALKKLVGFVPVVGDIKLGGVTKGVAKNATHDIIQDELTRDTVSGAIGGGIVGGGAEAICSNATPYTNEFGFCIF
jgi:hypothetical protein